MPVYPHHKNHFFFAFQAKLSFLTACSTPLTAEWINDVTVEQAKRKADTKSMTAQKKREHERDVEEADAAFDAQIRFTWWFSLALAIRAIGMTSM